MMLTANVPNLPPRYNVASTNEIPIVRIDPRDGVLKMARRPHSILDEGYAKVRRLRGHKSYCESGGLHGLARSLVDTWLLK
jgi:hypothetical protein